MLNVEPVPVLKDNYTWVLSRPGGTAAAIIDPGESEPVIRHLRERGLRLGAILVTHHHGDHVGGIPGLLAVWPVPVFAPASESIRWRSVGVEEGNLISLDSLPLTLRAMHVPGHTAGAIAYLGEGHLFSGDTLFAAGCGRLFEGTPAQMYASLRRLGAVPGETLLCCGHEYTLANLRFAQAVEPDNPHVAARIASARKAREAGRPTVPAPMALEADTNPFMRVHLGPVREAAERHHGRKLRGEPQVFAALRAWKDSFA